MLLVTVINKINEIDGDSSGGKRYGAAGWIKTPFSRQLSERFTKSG